MKENLRTEIIQLTSNSAAAMTMVAVRWIGISLPVAPASVSASPATADMSEVHRLADCSVHSFEEGWCYRSASPPPHR